MLGRLGPQEIEEAGGLAQGWLKLTWKHLVDAMMMIVLVCLFVLRY